MIGTFLYNLNLVATLRALAVTVLLIELGLYFWGIIASFKIYLSLDIAALLFAIGALIYSFIKLWMYPLILLALAEIIKQLKLKEKARARKLKAKAANPAE